jgi:hypothetical protein
MGRDLLCVEDENTLPVLEIVQNIQLIDRHIYFKIFIVCMYLPWMAVTDETHKTDSFLRVECGSLPRTSRQVSVQVQTAQVILQEGQSNIHTVLPLNSL